MFHIGHRMFSSRAAARRPGWWTAGRLRWAGASAVVLLGGGTLAVAGAPAVAAAPTVVAVPGLAAGPALTTAQAALAAAPASPAFVQQVSAHGSGKSSISVVPGTNVTAGNRLVVEVGVWKSAKATTSAVSDSSGDPFVEVTHFTASDGTEMSVWTAPVMTGGSKPTITAKPSAAGDMAIIALEYSGLSTVADLTAVDQVSHASGATTSAATVNSTATAPTTAAGELAVGFYVDSGFGDTLAGAGFAGASTSRPAGDIEMLAEDQARPGRATPKRPSAPAPRPTGWRDRRVRGSNQSACRPCRARRPACGDRG